MTEVHGHCQDCHEELVIDAMQVTLINYPDSGVVSFLCPHCGFPQSRTFTDGDEVLDAFRQTAGRTVAMPDEQPHTGATITLDDVITLGLELRDD